MKAIRCWGVVVAAALAAGCGGGTYSVSGQVLWQDGQAAKELAGGQVSFEPVDLGKPGATGAIRDDGSFRLGTTGQSDGAFPGRYRVVVSPKAEPTSAQPGRPEPPVIDPRYQTPGRSGLEVEVKEESNNVTLRLQRPKR